LFTKLSFDQLSRFYGALSELETCYGKEKVREAIVIMSDKLDAEIQKKQPQADPEQMSLFDHTEPTKGDDADKEYKRVYRGRNPKGKNRLTIETYVNKKWPHMDPEEVILHMYYMDGIKQSTIGDMFGVNQRAISQFLAEIPEIKKRRIMSKWGKAE
jgi:DNA-directed RNA polymerase specialized sigma subunit